VTAALWNVSRRKFLEAGTGLVVGIAYAPLVALAQDTEPAHLPGSLDGNRLLAAWLRVNPDGIVNQIEGGLIQSASWTLKEALKIDRSGIQTKSWIDYPILRFSEVPAVEVEVIQRPTEDSLGAGEGAQGPAAAAIANAFAAATGRRLRDIPFTPERVRAALA
jgi:nicotinate dehydrogenase subunit B